VFLKILKLKYIYDGKVKSTEKYEDIKYSKLILKKCDVVDRVSCLQHKMAHNAIKSSQMHIRMPKVGIFATKDQWYTMGIQRYTKDQWYTMGYNANTAGDMQLAGGQ